MKHLQNEQSSINSLNELKSFYTITNRKRNAITIAN